MSAAMTMTTSSVPFAVIRAAFLPALILLLAVITAIVEPRFLSQINITNVLRNAAFLAVISAGQMFVIVGGGFDLSVSAVVALTSVVSALVMGTLASLYPDSIALIIAGGVLAGLATGVLVGVFNGLCVCLLRASPFMVTLGSMSIAAGVAFLLTAGTPIYGLPAEFTRGFGRAMWLGIPVPVYIAVLLCVVVWFLQQRTAAGRHLYATGGNPHAARLSGISVGRNLVAIYVISAALAALTGVLLTARVGSGQATLGSDLMLQSIAACMIARVSLKGGVGRIENVVLGALFLSLLNNSMNLTRIDSKAQTIVMGLIVVVAVAIDQLSRKRSVHER
jgi:ribose transport system permease protein